MRMKLLKLTLLPTWIWSRTESVDPKYVQP
jgi:hypothetical protein